jgi:catechol 2,3-dioxygenase-like lactoylglutathione lyase family enzyme
LNPDLDSTRILAMTTLELNHVAIHVADVEKSSEFYRTVLKLEPIPRPAFTFPGAWFRLGACQELHIIGERREPVISHNRGNHYALRVDDLNAWEKHLQKSGAEYRPPKLRPDGAVQLFLRDPDGHTIELFTPPPQA